MALLLEPDEYVKKTQQVLANKINIFNTFPVCVENIIKYKLWSKVRDRKDNYFKSFEEFCNHRLPEGLEVKIDDLLIYLKDTPEVKAMVFNEIGEIGKHGGNHNPNGIGGKSHKLSNKKTESENKNSLNGTSKLYLIKRLKRDNPLLAEKLLNNEITANQAAKEAGIRKPYAQIRTDNLDHAIKILKKYYDKTEILKELNK